jgi:gas vesicle protein
MKFLIGTLLGFAAGLAGAILFAPEKRRGAPLWPEGHPASSLNGSKEGIRGAMRTLQEHVNEAWEEARIAAEKAESDMMAKYSDAAGRQEEPEPIETKKK